MLQETTGPGGFSVTMTDVERPVLNMEEADKTVVYSNNNKNLYSKSSINLNNSPANVEAHFNLNPKEKLRGPVVITVQEENETRHQCDGKQTPDNPDLGHKKRARRRTRGNKSRKGKMTNKGVGLQGEVKESKRPNFKSDEFLPE